MLESIKFIVLENVMTLNEPEKEQNVNPDANSETDTLLFQNFRVLPTFQHPSFLEP